MDRLKTSGAKQPFRLTGLLVLSLTCGLIPGVYSDAAAASRRTIYRDMFGNELGPNISPPRTTGDYWTIYSDGGPMGFSGPASSQGFRNYGLYKNLGDSLWPPY